MQTTKTDSTKTSRFARSPEWVAKKEDAKHREVVASTMSLEASDDWLDDVDGE